MLYKDSVFESTLPLQYVSYGRHYWSSAPEILSFSDSAIGEQYICSCTLPAIDQSIIIHEQMTKAHVKDILTCPYYLFKNIFPVQFQHHLPTSDMEMGEPTEEFTNTGWRRNWIEKHQDKNNISDSNFWQVSRKTLQSRTKASICHRCNSCSPTIMHHEKDPILGGRPLPQWNRSKFARYHGYYMAQTALIAGLYFGTEPQIDIPQEFEHLNNHINQEHNRILAIDSWTDTEMEKSKQLDKLAYQYNNWIENIVRDEFGWPQIGDCWANETLLFSIIRSIFTDFNDSEFIRHYRPNWLEGLELDIYIKRLNLGVEYNGQQHYNPIEYFGGLDSHREQVERDRRKARLCKERGLNLLIVKYDEPLKVNYIKDRLSSLGIDFH